MFFVHFLVLSSGAIRALSASPTVTAFNPHRTLPVGLAERAEDPGLVGWATDSLYKGYTTMSCVESATWTQVGSYGRCCPTTVNFCDFPTACVRGSVLVLTDTSITCTTSAPACIEDYVLENVGDSNTITWIGCDLARQASSVFRTSPASSSSTPIITSGSSTSTITSTITTIPPTPSPTPTPSSSKAWIAGAVVGPVAGIAIIAGLIFWIFRLKQKARREPADSQLQYQQQQMSLQPTSPPPLYGFSSTKEPQSAVSPVESSVQQRSYPIVQSQYGVVELGAK